MRTRRVLTLLWVAALVVTGLDAADSGRTLGIWSISDLHRNHSAGNNTCHWSFLVDESEDPAEDTPARCAFDVRSANSSLGCEKSSFHDVECGNGKITFFIGGGWNSFGFTVLVLVNYAETAMAYFGYSDAELNGDKPISEQRKPAVMLGSEHRRIHAGVGNPTNGFLQYRQDG